MRYMPILIMMALMVGVWCSLQEDLLRRKVISMRRLLTGRTLLVKWKLAHEENFRINAKNTMINKNSNQRKRSASTYSFFPPSSLARQGNAFFEAPTIDTEPQGLYLQLYEGAYRTGAAMVVEIPLNSEMETGIKPEKGYTLWSTAKNQFITCQLLDNGRVIGKFVAEAKIEIFANLREGRQVDGDSKIWVNFYSNSLIFFADLEPVTDQYDQFSYLVLASSLVFLLSLLFLKPRKSVYNLSEWMIVQTVAFIWATNLILFIQGFTRLDTKLWVVSVGALANIAMSLLLVRNYEDVVLNEFKYRSKAVLLGIYLVVYFGLIISFWKSQVFWIYEGFILFAVQISYSYSKGGKGGMALKLIFSILVTRSPFIYYRFLLEELTRQPNSYPLLIAFIGINLILLTFIALQRYFGSRFLIPKELIPDYFNYFQKDISLETLKEECSICNQILSKDPDNPDGPALPEDKPAADSSGHEEADVSREILRKVVLMVTPCSHSYHPKCLQDWMDKRLNCPLCRTSLPPSEEQRDDSYCC